MKKINFVGISFAIIMLMLLGLLPIPQILAATENYGMLNVMLLNQDPDPAEPGKYVEFRWKVTKEGTRTLNDVSFEFPNQYPFSIDGSEQSIKRIDDWSGYAGQDEYYILYYKVYVDPNAPEDTYDIDLTVNASGSTIKKTFGVRVDDSKNPQIATGIIRTEPTKLMPDSTDNKINVELLNLGESDAELVVASLVLPKGFESTYSYSSISSLGTISGGSSKSAVFYLDVDDNITADSYPATLKITYREEGETSMVTKEIPIALEIKNKPMFEVIDVSYEPDSINAGDKVNMRVTIKNIGTKEADSISLRAFKESSQPFDFDEKSDFIGTLKPGENGTAVMTLNIDKDANSKQYLIDLEVRSIYNDDVFAQSEVASIDITAQKSGFIEKYWMGLLIAVALIAVVAYLSLKKK